MLTIDFKLFVLRLYEEHKDEKQLFNEPVPQLRVYYRKNKQFIINKFHEEKARQCNV